MKIPNFMRKALLAKANAIMTSREPDFIIRPAGRDQTLRWHVIPRNRWFNIYVHKWIESDDDRAPHDHPYHNASILLEGHYVEWMLRHPHAVAAGDTRERPFMRRQGHIYLRKAMTAHRVELREYVTEDYRGDTITMIHPWGFNKLPGRTYTKAECITLFITGRRFRDWGFHCPKGFVREDEFRDGRDKGKTGKGCD